MNKNDPSHSFLTNFVDQIVPAPHTEAEAGIEKVEEFRYENHPKDPRQVVRISLSSGLKKYGKWIDGIFKEN